MLNHAQELQILPWHLARLMTNAFSNAQTVLGFSRDRQALRLTVVHSTLMPRAKLWSIGPSLQRNNAVQLHVRLSSPANATSQQNLHSADDCVEELKHGPNVSPDDIADIPLLNRLVVPSAKRKLFWTNSDQALDAMLEKECPNFDHLPPAAALRQLERAVHFFFFLPLSPKLLTNLRKILKKKNKKSRKPSKTASPSANPSQGMSSTFVRSLRCKRRTSCWVSCCA